MSLHRVSTSWSPIQNTDRINRSPKFDSIFPRLILIHFALIQSISVWFIFLINAKPFNLFTHSNLMGLDRTFSNLRHLNLMYFLSIPLHLPHFGWRWFQWTCLDLVGHDMAQFDLRCNWISCILYPHIFIYKFWYLPFNGSMIKSILTWSMS